MQDTPVALPLLTIILFTLVSVRTVKFSLSNAGTKYAFAALHLFPSF
jgi:hypothetical protein